MDSTASPARLVVVTGTGKAIEPAGIAIEEGTFKIFSSELQAEAMVSWAKGRGEPSAASRRAKRVSLVEPSATRKPGAAATLSTVPEAAWVEEEVRDKKRAARRRRPRPRRLAGPSQGRPFSVAA
jgi:hypothetical protein